jgi:hypothetical protein
MTSFMICIAHQYYSGGHIKDCLDVWYEWRRREIYSVLVWKREGKNPFVELGVDGLMALRYIIRKGAGVGRGLD